MKQKTPKAAAVSPKVDLPQRPQTRILQAHISPSLFDAVKAEARRQKRYMRDVVEWGLKEFLAHSAPAQAKRLGIAFRK